MYRLRVYYSNILDTGEFFSTLIQTKAILVLREEKIIDLFFFTYGSAIEIAMLLRSQYPFATLAEVVEDKIHS